MIDKILAKKIISAIAYTIVGSEVVKGSLTMENARRVASVSKRIAVRAGTSIKSKANGLKQAVKDRKDEIKMAKSDEDSLI